MQVGRDWRRSGTNVSLFLSLSLAAVLGVAGACSRQEAAPPPPAASPAVPPPAPIPVRDAAPAVVDAAGDAGDARSRGGARKSAAPASGALKVDGSLSRADGEKVVRAGQGKLRACFDAAKPAGSGAKGRVSFKMTVDDRGHVTVAEIPTSSLPGGSDVETCMVHVLRDLRFPRSAGESSISFQMSFGR